MQISISVDDGCDSDFKLAKLLQKYNIKGVFYWPVDVHGLSLNKHWPAITPNHEEYIANNFEIGSHTISHRYLTQIPFEEAYDEITQSRKMLQEKYGQEITKFCYPRGYANESLIEAVKEAGYDYGRSTAIGYIGNPENPYFAPTAVHIGCPIRTEYIGTNWYDYGIKLFKKAKEQNLDFEAWCHSWEIDRYNEWDNVEQFLMEISRG